MGGVRVLYLGWLLRVQEGEVAEDVTEPDLPAGLDRLSRGEAALVDFLRIDHHLIAAAVQRRIVPEVSRAERRLRQEP